MKYPLGRILLIGSMCLMAPVVFAPVSQAQTQAPAQTQTETPPTDLAAGLAAYDNFRYDDAARILKPLADQGNAEAQYVMAMLHSFGQGGLDASPVLYLPYARKAEAQGHIGARLIVAGAYLDGIGTKQDSPRGVRLAESVLQEPAATKENKAEAHDALGYAYQEGLGVKMSLPKALGHFKKSYLLEPMDFKLNEIIRMLDDGLGGTFDEEVEWYRKLAILGEKDAFAKVKAHADKGDAQSQYVVGIVYYGDRTLGFRDRENVGDIADNGQLSREYLERAAAGNVGDAVWPLFDLLVGGFPTKDRIDTAKRLFLAAPTMKFREPENLINAHVKLGTAYFTGGLVPRDHDTAVLGEFYKTGFVARDLAKAEEHFRAAQYADGYNELGKAFFYGIDTPRDFSRAVKLFEDGAALNHAKSQFNLALIHLDQASGPNVGLALEMFAMMTDKDNPRKLEDIKDTDYTWSITRALELFKLSADNGYPRGQAMYDCVIQQRANGGPPCRITE